MNPLDTLLSIASDALASGSVDGEATHGLVDQYFALVARRNGFYAFASALLVRPVGGPLDVFDWNRDDGWRQGYGDLADGLFFFAEDLFGGQFATVDDHVVSFDPETGGQEFMGDSLASWAELILSDPGVATGYPLAQDWQQTHGPLSPGQRLMPRVPFIANGAFEVDNLLVVPDELRMRRGGKLAQTWRNLPDGAPASLPYHL